MYIFMEEKMSKTIVRFLILTAIVSLFAVTSLSAEENGFLFRLSRELKAFGWTDEEISSFLFSAETMSWKGLENGDAEMVALSLHYCWQKQIRFQTSELVQLAYHLAVMGMEMEALGFRRRNITKTALRVSAEVAEQLRVRDKADNQNGTGELIRDRIREELCKEGLEEYQEKIMERLTKRVQEGKSSQHRYSGVNK